MSDFATVAVDGYTVTSTSESAESMISALTPPKDEPAVPREVKPDSKEPETDQETDEAARVSRAASDLGKKGGEATAAKRAVAAKEEAKAEKDAAAGSEAEKDAEAEKLGKPRHDAKARMLEATRQAAEVKRELERERAERARLAAEVEQLRKPAETKQETPTGRPKVEDYDTYEGYLDARDEWNDRQRETREAERARFAARHQGISTAFQTFAGRVEEARKTDTSFMERTSWFGNQQPSFTLPKDEHGRPVGLRASHVLTDEIISSENAPALMLHFAEHPEDLQRIEALRTPLDVQLAVAKIEGRLDAASTATAPRAEVSKANPPVRPVAGSPYTADVVPGDDASYDEHVRYYSAKETRRR